jgi:hypothetical protein
MKKYYRISIFKSHRLGELLANLAAKSNGGNYVSLADLVNVTKSEKLQYPTLCGEFTAELIGDNLLHIDAKNGDTYETVCSIEEVEVFELEGGAAMAD